MLLALRFNDDDDVFESALCFATSKQTQLPLENYDVQTGILRLQIV